MKRTWHLPRAKLPTLGLMAVVHRSDFDSIESNNENNCRPSNLLAEQLSSSSYRTTYNCEQPPGSIDSEFFKKLENITSIRSSIPRPQISSTIDTLNSLQVRSDNSDSFSGFDELDEIEFVSNMMNDLTKDDNINDDLIEALNPHFAIPRANPVLKPTGLFSVSTYFKCSRVTAISSSHNRGSKLMQELINKYYVTAYFTSIK
ncbi:unnamed protein product [Didymodactylos carnosus]|uniref:Uncharacterized protein n=1 Tax=Didymodactylos carnosus TaxID=1234261 RepID=A0A813SD12_9BILA|nr:unnamed protein product [Didymodactylos carnosus]CAF1136397.1 unnamed protein product [Didymodactylos carnosus]CAF3579087.1 unnamed protein product [Didymodactylos carnosus]CAF3925802.1 unnamed protein product [Didymodactylos carnosus]